MERQDVEGFAALRALLKKKPPAAPGERCDFCVVELGAAHGHLIDLQARRILCACRPCWLVMAPEGAARGRYKAVPTRYLEIEALAVGADEWESLQIPIALAFFFYNSLEKKMVAFYPGPAGATESLLPLETWDAIVARDAALRTLEPDVEALLVYRRDEGTRCFIVPIDAAYELVGLIRTSWRGFAGGEEAWRRIEAFFASLRERCAGRVTEPVT
jgi:Family of unknown function (DUF5947)